MYLGTAGAVGYEAGDFRTGLKGIYCMIQRPDMVMEGPFPLTEGSSLASGLYFYNYPTTDDMLEGCYLALIFSPQENLRSTRRLEFIRRPLPEIIVNAGGEVQTTVHMVPQPSVEVYLPAPAVGVEVKAIQSHGVVSVDMPAGSTTEVDLHADHAHVTAVNDNVTFDVEIHS